MTKVFCVVVALLLTAPAFAGQYTMAALGVDIVAHLPGEKEWEVANKQSASDKGIVMFFSRKHPFKDPNLINPSLAVMYEKLPASIDTLSKYVQYAMSRSPFPVIQEKTYPDRIIQICKWKNKYQNYMVRAYILCDGVGVQIMGTVTDRLYRTYKGQLVTFAEQVTLKSAANQPPESIR